MTCARPLAALRRDIRGATVVEFGIVAPVMCTLLLGSFDVAHDLYTRAVLQGVVQKTARDATLEGGGATPTAAALDEKVTRQAKAMVNDSTVAITRRFYRSFADAAAQKPEPFTDTNGNGRRDAKECFDDVNGNLQWDADPGRTGQGGANDVTLYTFELKYPRLFPVAGLFGLSPDNTLIARTLLKNQPFARQTVATVKSVCT